MKISSRFTVAVHTLLVIHIYGSSQKVTSDFIASSVRVNPVVIRRTLLSLKAAGMVEVKAGSGAAARCKGQKLFCAYHKRRPPLSDSRVR